MASGWGDIENSGRVKYFSYDAMAAEHHCQISFGRVLIRLRFCRGKHYHLCHGAGEISGGTNVPLASERLDIVGQLQINQYQPRRIAGANPLPGHNRRIRQGQMYCLHLSG